MLQRAARNALAVARNAAHTSQAYRTLLREQGTDAASATLDQLPVLTKANTFERFALKDLCRPLSPRQYADVLTSSGRGGPSFGFRISTRAQFESAWFGLDLGLQSAFNVDQLPTLLVNCLPMGVLLQSRAVTVANLSVRADMACAVLRAMGPRYAQTLLCTDPLFIRPLLDQARAAGIDWSALNTSVIMGEEVLVEAQRDYIAAHMGIDLGSPGTRAILSSFGIGELGLNLLVETRETVQLRRALRSRADIAELLLGSGQVASPPSVFCFNPLRCHIEVLNPDARGFGELCFTLLDRTAVIPLPRYATGDVGRLVRADELHAAARLAATAVPWLPVLLLQGRIKDRAPGIPSVEDVKEFIYTDHGLADRLTGAFRLEAARDKGLTLTLQAHPSATPAELALLQPRLAALAHTQGLERVDLQLLSALDFPHRPLLDYERKFSYVGAPTF
jgi:phenylacetate-CoA ligase